MSGRHPIHTGTLSVVTPESDGKEPGLQDNVLVGAAPYALSPDLRIMPQHLTRLGYEARAVGKWHLGSHTASVTPTHRYNLICPVSIVRFYELEYRFNLDSAYELAETFARDIRGRHNSILHPKWKIK